MPGENRFRLIGNVPEELEGKEEITAEDVQRVLDRRSGLKTRITKVRWSSVYRTHRRMTERFRVGRVFLVGDAAHIHSPAGGQGKVRFVMSWLLAAVQKLLQMSVFLLARYRECLPLFVWVSVLLV